MKSTIMVSVLSLLGFVSISFGQQDTTWNTWNWLIGDWTGEGSGVPGQGAGYFSFQPDLGGKILLRKNHSEYPAVKDKPEIIHDDLMIVYRDKSDQTDKATYFDNEGNVINYSITYSQQSIVLTSGKVKNSPIFRLTYDALANEAIGVKFEMSRDGEKFVTYTEGKCRKKK